MDKVRAGLIEEIELLRAERAAALDKLQKTEAERDASQKACIECQGVRDRMEWEAALKEHAKTKAALAELTFRNADLMADLLEEREKHALTRDALIASEALREDAEHALRLARREGVVRVPVRIGPPLEFTSNDDLRIDKEDK